MLQKPKSQTGIFPFTFICIVYNVKPVINIQDVKEHCLSAYYIFVHL